MEAEDGRVPTVSMARFLLVLRPSVPKEPRELIEGLGPLLEGLQAAVDHRTPAHLSAMLNGGSDNLPLQLFADVQARASGPVLELVLMSREAMGRGAPQTRQSFETLVELALQTQPDLEAVFRSDRDGPLPDRQAAAGGGDA